MLALNRQVTPPRPTSSPDAERSPSSNLIGRSVSGAARTVEVELEFETPQPHPPKAGTQSSSRLQKALPNIFRRAKCFRSANASSYSSKRSRTAPRSQRKKFISLSCELLVLIVMLCIICAAAGQNYHSHREPSQESPATAPSAEEAAGKPSHPRPGFGKGSRNRPRPGFR